MAMKKSLRILSLALATSLLLSIITACSNVPETTVDDPISATESDIVDLADVTAGEVPLAAGPAVSSLIRTPVASGVTVKKNEKAEIDVSNAADGYMMIRYLGSNKKIKVLVTGPSKVTYTYTLRTDKSFEVFPLPDGNGAYKVGVYENISGTKYSTALSHSFSVTLTDQNAPFLTPNQYVNYNAKTKVVVKATELTAKCKTTVDKIKAVYDFVITNFTYDKALAESVAKGELTGYLPNLDNVYTKKKGICFDYASTMTAMLRSQGVPTKLVIGYTGKVYHAWINTYSVETGWIENVIYFDGKQWKLMDPTFASTGKQSSSIMKYIGDGANYTAKFIY